MWLSRICLLAVFRCFFRFLVESAETGNSLVTCAACQTLQAQIENWSCDINCQVAEGSNDDLVSIGIINQLIETVKQLNETITKQAKMIQNQTNIINSHEERFGKLEAPVCTFSARGPDSEMMMNINEDTILVFENVDLNVCGGYDNTTGVYTVPVSGVYMLSTLTRGGGNSARIQMKRNNDVLCKAWVINSYTATTSCTVTVRLTAGESVRVTGGSEAGNIHTDLLHFAGHLIQANQNN